MPKPPPTCRDCGIVLASGCAKRCAACNDSHRLIQSNQRAALGLARLGQLRAAGTDPARKSAADHKAAALRANRKASPE